MNNQKFMRNINVISRCATAYREERLSQYGITGNQAPYISIICAHAGITPKEIADRMHVNKSTVTRIIEKLEKNGFVEQKRSNSDKRTLQIYPTDKATDIQDTVRGTFREWRERLTTVLSEQQLDMIEELTEILMKRAVDINENNI